MNSPLISIVMPTLNQKAFIEESVGSVLSQSYSRLELIVADGGSSDGTIDFLRERALRDPRVRWSSQGDTGPAEALNRALGMARGTLIGWLNSDDLYVPGALARVVDTFNQQANILMVYGHGVHIDGGGELIGRYPTLPPKGPLQRFADGCFICQPAVFFRRSMYVMLGNLDQDLKASFDFDYWLRAFKAFDYRIGFIDEVLAMSRLHDACITQRARRTVAVEGVRVIARHLGRAPIHWVVTYIDELVRDQGETIEQDQLSTNILGVLEAAKEFVDPGELEALKMQLSRSVLADCATSR